MIVDAILIGHIIAVLVVLAAFFVDRTWLRPLAVVLAAVAICLPYLALRTSLGRPNPDTVPGRYEMFARKQDYKNGVLYFMIGQRGSDWPPRLFSMPMKSRGTPGASGQGGGRNYDVIDVTISDDDTGDITFNQDEYQLPDPNKEAYYQRLRNRSNGGG